MKIDYRREESERKTFMPATTPKSMDLKTWERSHSTSFYFGGTCQWIELAKQNISLNISLGVSPYRRGRLSLLSHYHHWNA